MSTPTEDANSIESAESTGTVEEVKLPSIEEFESLKKKLDSITSAQQGSDSKVTELQKLINQKNSELEEERKKGLSAEELLAHESKANEQRAIETANKLKTLENTNRVKDFLLEKNLDKSFEQYLNPEMESSLDEQLEGMLAMINAEVEKQVINKIKTKTPIKGDPSDLNKESIDDRIQAAQSKGDFVTVMALKEQKRTQQ
jgi:C-terminal processing protease CtpA/Prc